jgi:hypothetical protein
VADREHSEFEELCNEAMALCINVGIMDSVSDRWPEHVQEAWYERIMDIKRRLGQEIVEVQEFASSYD